MKDKLKALAREILPPFVLRALSGNDTSIRFTDGYRTWEEARAASSGYDAPSILEKVTEASLKVKRGEAAYERDSVLFDRIDYSWPVLAGLLWAAVRGGGKLRVLDVGGSLGSSYRRHRKFLADRVVSWSVVEQPGFVAVGRKSFEDGTLSFFASVEEALPAGDPSVVLFESSLHYLEDPYALLERIARVPHDLLIVDRTPFSGLETDRICVQHVSPAIYAASYPAHILSRGKFEQWIAARGWKVVESFDAIPGRARTSSGLALSFGGYLLAR
jgi:putative methyltransferase (TIGR04325 family)